MRKPTNRQQRFRFAIIKGLERLGINATPTTTFGYEYEVQTKYGSLLVRPEAQENSRTARVYSCYCRFQDVDKAKDHVDCNPYSGKWNFHHWVTDASPEHLALQIILKIKRLLA